jgi:hypothetical protein
MQDFPAAHSMDTTWFAIDRDGHVAMFETGEAGCVPRDAYLGEDYGPVKDAMRAFPDNGLIIDIEGRRAGSHRDHWSFEQFAHITGPVRLCAVVRDLESIQDLLAPLEARETRATTTPCISIRPQRDNPAFRTLHERGACLHCFYEESDDEDGDIATHGVFRYGQPGGGGLSEPYTRESIPVKPLTEITPEVRSHAVRYDGRFADTTRLQPAELWPCEAWGPAWLASDGKTVHPFEGREDDYAEEVAHLDPGEFVIIEPPARTTTPKRARKPWWKFW